MKKYITLLLALLTLASCASHKDIKINSLQLEKISFVDTPLKALVSAEIENPTVTLRIEDALGVVKMSGEEVLEFTCAPFTLNGKSTESYRLDVFASLKSGFGLQNIMKILQAQDLSDITLDFTLTARDPLGIKHKVERKDLPVLQR